MEREVVSTLQRKGAFDQWRGQITQKFSEAVRKQSFGINCITFDMQPLLPFIENQIVVKRFFKLIFDTPYCQGLLDQFKQKTRDLIERSGLIKQHMSSSQGTEGLRRLVFGKLVDNITKFAQNHIQSTLITVLNCDLCRSSLLSELEGSMQNIISEQIPDLTATVKTQVREGMPLSFGPENNIIQLTLRL
jgi:hypothetical protein